MKNHGLALLFLGIICAAARAHALDYSGIIVNDIGRPAAGATIEVKSVADPSKYYSAVTDTTGLFSFDITDVETDKPIPFRLYGNFPNPFNPTTRISYSLDDGADVRIDIYNVLGQHVRSIDHGYREPGYYTALWDGRDDRGWASSAGVYLYRLSAGGRSLTSKMLMVDAATGSWIGTGRVPMGTYREVADILFLVTITHPDAETLSLGPMTLNATTDTVLVIDRYLDKMNLVKANTFFRGTQRREYPYIYPPHQVTITHDYMMDKYEMTSGIFCTVMNHALARGAIVVDGREVRSVEGDPRPLFLIETGNDVSNSSIIFEDAAFHARPGYVKLPVTYVSWYGAMFFCYERNMMEGLDQTIDIDDWSCDIKKNGYRLPTDCEWELAAKWTDNRDYAYGPDPGYYKPMNTQLNDDGFDNDLSPVGWFSPQGDSHDGLCDMSGNVFEWVLDWQGTYEMSWKDSAFVDLTGPLTGVNKIARGGSAFGCFRSARTFDKTNMFIETMNRSVGFRTVRPLVD